MTEVYIRGQYRENIGVADAPLEGNSTPKQHKVSVREGCWSISLMGGLNEGNGANSNLESGQIFDGGRRR